MKKQESANKSDTKKEDLVLLKKSVQRRPELHGQEFEKYYQHVFAESSPDILGSICDTTAFSSSVNMNQKANIFNYLHQCYGNAYLQRTVQAKLNIGKPDDIYEKEADMVAKKVLNQSNQIIEQKADTNKKEKLVQLKVNPHTSQKLNPHIENQIKGIKNSGKVFPESDRNCFEKVFSHDFSKVHIHTDIKAASLANSISARAFTSGNDIVFNRGEYSPQTKKGKTLLAHELTHVIQQNDNENLTQGFVQCWPFFYHWKLTSNGIDTLPSPIAPELTKTLAERSGDMDIKEKEFNEMGYSIIHAPILKKETKLSLLQNFYSKSQEKPKNHGEGGLYKEDFSTSIAINEAYQMKKEDELTAFFSNFPDDQYSILTLLGDILHITQDRGAHGEGAKGRGHGGQIFYPEIDPDNPSLNLYGNSVAEKNTRIVLNRFSYILQLLSTLSESEESTAPGKEEVKK